MKQHNAWCYFDNAPENLCNNPIVADACFRGATLRILSRTETRATVDYKGNIDAVPTDCMLDRQAPAYTWGENVSITAHGTRATVVDICWHYTKKCFFYYLDALDGTPIKQRYFENELQKA